MARFKEIEEYRQYTKPAELHKAVNTLRGIVAGITTDQVATDDEINELSNWCMSHQHLIDRHPFSELLPMIENAYNDGIVTSEEADNIVWLCNNFVSDSKYYDIITSSLQFLSGMLHGIMADGEISDDEIHSLQTWIRANEYLTGCYPFDEIESLLLSVLQDGKITEDERNVLKSFFSNFIDITVSYNLNQRELEELRSQYDVSGICAVCQEINFEDSFFCITGSSKRAKRNEIASMIESLGGHFSPNVTNKTNYLIVCDEGNPCWAFACYGRKVEDAIDRRKHGQNLTLISEVDFWDSVEDNL